MTTDQDIGTVEQPIPKEVTATAYDGSVHHFDPGTPPDVMDRVMKDYTTQTRATANAQEPLGGSFGKGLRTSLESTEVGRNVGAAAGAIARTGSDLVSLGMKGLNALGIGDPSTTDAFVQAGERATREMHETMGEHPVTELLSGTLPYLIQPYMGATRAAVGLAGKTLGRAVVGAGTGAVQGAATEAGTTGGDIGTGAAVGAGAGGLMSGVLGGMGTLVNKIRNTSVVNALIQETKSLGSLWDVTSDKLVNDVKASFDNIKAAHDSYTAQLQAWTDPNTGLKKPFVNQHDYNRVQNALQNLQPDYDPFTGGTLKQTVNAQGAFGGGRSIEQANNQIIRDLTGQDVSKAMRIWNALSPNVRQDAKAGILDHFIEGAMTPQGQLDPTKFIVDMQNSPAVMRVFFSGYQDQARLQGLKNLMLQHNLEAGATNLPVQHTGWWNTHSALTGLYGAAAGGAVGYKYGGEEGAVGAGAVTAIALIGIRSAMAHMIRTQSGLNWLASNASLTPGSPAAEKFYEETMRRFGGAFGPPTAKEALQGEKQE